VIFQPGARSAWHTHPLGQILIVTDGVGWIQQWDGPVQVIRKGDVVWIPPGIKHWHGATPTTTMTHIAVQESLNGVAVNCSNRSRMSSTNSTDKTRTWRNADEHIV
jgi:quercetin dioxygenase-like cupin family protein